MISTNGCSLGSGYPPRKSAHARSAASTPIGPGVLTVTYFERCRWIGQLVPAKLPKLHDASLPAMEENRLDLGQILERFPKDAALVMRLVLESETFRNVCEDYVLARSVLSALEDIPEPERDQTRLVDYRRLVMELEEELAATLRQGCPSR